MNKTTRKLYVTQDELNKLHEIADGFSGRRCGVCYTDKYVAAVAELLDIELHILVMHIWHIEVVNDVRVRIGRDWTVRGTGRHRGACRGR